MKILVIIFSFILYVQGLKCRSEEIEETQVEFQDALRRCMVNEFSEVKHSNDRHNWNKYSNGDHNNTSSGNMNREGEPYMNKEVYPNQQELRHRNQDRQASQRQNYPAQSSNYFFERNNQQNNSFIQYMNPCTIHCIFRQLQMLDAKSYIDKESVISVLTHSIRDVELKDLIEDMGDECFEKINSAENKNDLCQISKLFATCLEEKGKTSCEDWWIQ